MVIILENPDQRHYSSGIAQIAQRICSCTLNQRIPVLKCSYQRSNCSGVIELAKSLCNFISYPRILLFSQRPNQRFNSSFIIELAESLCSYISDPRIHIPKYLDQWHYGIDINKSLFSHRSHLRIIIFERLNQRFYSLCVIELAESLCSYTSNPRILVLLKSPYHRYYRSCVVELAESLCSFISDIIVLIFERLN